MNNSGSCNKYHNANKAPCQSNKHVLSIFIMSQEAFICLTTCNFIIIWSNLRWVRRAQLGRRLLIWIFLSYR